MTDDLVQLESEILSRPWFYHFQLPSGRVTECYLPAGVEQIHTTRERMLLETLTAHIGSDWQALRCLDLACHEGYFSFSVARQGCAEVVGIDARPEHIESANLLRRTFNMPNVRFQVGDIQRLDAADLGQFDVTLLFGILYHLENPIGVLRLCHALTKRVCLIETQIAPHLAGPTDWGSHLFTQQILGCFAIVDETDNLARDDKEANITPISLFPSLPALLWLLTKVGFKRAQVIEPPPDAYEQFRSGKRVIVAAYNT